VAYNTRGWKEGEDYPLLRELARGRTCIFDVGANMGQTALLMATVMDSEGKIFAFEASEQACRVLIENVSRNRLGSKVIPINAVVAERSGEVVDFYWEYTSGGASIVYGHLGHTFAIKKCTLSLDDFCARQGLRPELVKIDVEGGEERVLRGMQDILRKIQPPVLVEVHRWPTEELASRAAAVWHLARAVGYEVFHPQWSRFLDEQDVKGLRGFRCWLLLVAEREQVPEGWRGKKWG
jgi:FkbM family methyltransferase